MRPANEPRISIRPAAPVRACATAMLAVLLSPMAAADDTLGDFERSAGEREKGIAVEDQSEPLDEGAGILALAALPIVGWFSIAHTHEVFAKRRAGEPAGAMLRLEPTYQRLRKGDVDAYNLRGEIAFSFLGLAGEFTRYKEGNPVQSLDLQSYELLFRILPSRKIELKIAGGVRRLEGDRDRTAGQGGISLGFYPEPWIGVEVDLRWAKVKKNLLEDYRAGLSLRHPAFPFIGLRGGYRSVALSGERLDGGEVGVVFTF